MLGFAGLAFDGELYGQQDGATATWTWDYPGNSHAETAVRAKVRERGAQMMTAIVGSFPSAEIVDYDDSHFPEGWEELVQAKVNGTRNANADSVQINFWDGMTSVEGYGPIRLMDAVFYKTWHISGASWETALSYNANRLMAYLSRNLSNWSYASSRISISPFAWIDEDVANEGDFTAARSPAYVSDQLAAFRKWGMGGEFSVFAYHPLGAFDYTPYIEGMRAAATPGLVDTARPSISVASVRRNDDRLRATGVAADNLAIRSVRWRSASNSGAAKMRWVVSGGDYFKGYQWKMHWTADVPATVGQQRVVFTAEDIKGLTTTVAAPRAASNDPR